MHFHCLFKKMFALMEIKSALSFLFFVWISAVFLHGCKQLTC